jgi:hypothetical protein
MSGWETGLKDYGTLAFELTSQRYIGDAAMKSTR